MADKPDIRTEPVEGAPVSLRKFIEAGHTIAPLTLIVDGTPTRAGIAPDDPDTFNILTADREQQAQYFLSLNLPMPDYLRKYLALVYPKADLDALYKNARTNIGARQVIGMIQLIAGALHMAKKAGKGVRLYIEHPETHLHPEQQAGLASMFIALQKDYDPTEPKPETPNANP